MSIYDYLTKSKIFDGNSEVTKVYDGENVVHSKMLISFDEQGGDQVSDIYGYLTQAYGTLPTPNYSGYYNFLGWYTDPTSGTEVTAATIISNPDNHTLYAHVQKVAAQVTMNVIEYGNNYIKFTAYNPNPFAVSLHYEVDDSTPDLTVTIQAEEDTSIITISGLSASSHTLYYQTWVYGGGIKSSLGSYAFTTPAVTAPSFYYIAGYDNDSIRFRIKNNDTVTRRIYYEVGDSTPDANYIDLGPGSISGYIYKNGLSQNTTYTVYIQGHDQSAGVSTVVSDTATTLSLTKQWVYIDHSSSGFPGADFEEYVGSGANVYGAEEAGWWLEAHYPAANYNEGDQASILDNDYEYNLFELQYA